MNKQPEYTWSERYGTATCTLFYKNYEFTGVANCHPDDQDMMSKLTGQTIAEYRATLQYLRFIRDCELQPQLKALKQLYYSINYSKYFNPHSYEAQMLYRQINILEEDIKAIKDEIERVKIESKSYIEQKEVDRAKIRALKVKKALVENNQEICN